MPAPHPRRRSACVPAPRSPAAASRSMPAGRHRWWPIAPAARVEVALERPALRWSGAGLSSTPTPATRRWSRTSSAGTGARAPLPGGGAACSTTCEPRGGGRARRSRCASGPAARSSRRPAAAARAPAAHGCGGCRARRADPGAAARVVRTLEDAPFYARSVVVDAHLRRGRRRAVHESLSLDRFRRPGCRRCCPSACPARGVDRRQNARFRRNENATLAPAHTPSTPFVRTRQPMAKAARADRQEPAERGPPRRSGRLPIPRRPRPRPAAFVRMRTRPRRRGQARPSTARRRRSRRSRISSNAAKPSSSPKTRNSFNAAKYGSSPPIPSSPATPDGPHLGGVARRQV